MLFLPMMAWLVTFVQITTIVHLSTGDPGFSAEQTSYYGRRIIEGYQEMTRKRLEAGKAPRLQFDCLVEDGSSCILMQRPTATDIWLRMLPLAYGGEVILTKVEEDAWSYFNLKELFICTAIVAIVHLSSLLWRLFRKARAEITHQGEPVNPMLNHSGARDEIIEINPSEVPTASSKGDTSAPQAQASADEAVNDIATIENHSAEESHEKQVAEGRTAPILAESSRSMIAGGNLEATEEPQIQSDQFLMSAPPSPILLAASPSTELLDPLKDDLEDVLQYQLPSHSSRIQGLRVDVLTTSDNAVNGEAREREGPAKFLASSSCLQARFDAMPPTLESRSGYASPRELQEIDDSSDSSEDESFFEALMSPSSSFPSGHVSISSSDATMPLLIASDDSIRSETVSPQTPGKESSIGSGCLALAEGRMPWVDSVKGSGGNLYEESRVGEGQSQAESVRPRTRWEAGQDRLPSFVC